MILFRRELISAALKEFEKVLSLQSNNQDAVLCIGTDSNGHQQTKLSPAYEYHHFDQRCSIEGEYAGYPLKAHIYKSKGRTEAAERQIALIDSFKNQPEIISRKVFSNGSFVIGLRRL